MDRVPDDDDCRKIFDQILTPSPSEALRGLVLAETIRQLRRRRRLRHFAFAVALAGCYAAGLGTMGVYLRGAPIPASRPVADRPVTGDSGGSSDLADSEREPDAPRPEQVAQDIDVPVPAFVLERWAGSAIKGRRAAMYRRAGDSYLGESGDLEAALRCYARSLDLSSEQDLAVSVETDNWLLIALKQARQKEIHHAKNDG